MSKKTICGSLLLAFILRLTYSLLVHPPDSFIHSDIAIYLRIADEIKAGHWSPEHFVQPIGFPLLLVAIKQLMPDWSIALAILQALASTMTLYFVWKAAEASWGTFVARWSLFIGIFHLPWILYTGYAMAETVYTLLLSMLLWLSSLMMKGGRRPVIGCCWGLVFITAFWLKGQHAFLLPLFILAYFFVKGRRDSLKVIFPLVGMVVVGLFLHAALTHTKIGKIQLSGSTSGLNLVEGKCPSKKNTDATGLTWWSPLYHSLHMSSHKKWDRPFSDSTYFMQEGFKCIAKDPWVMVQSLEHVMYLFFGNSLWPSNWQPFGQKVRLYEVFFTAFILPGFLIFILVTYKSKNLADVMIWVLPVFSLFLLVYVFKSEIRYRIPFDVFFIPVAIRGWSLLGEALAEHLPGLQLKQG